MSKLKLLLCIVFINCSIYSQTYLNHNVTLLSHLDPGKDTTRWGERYSGCWGWYQASKNKEYAIIGAAKNTYYIDVTNPTNPVIVDSVEGRAKASPWREVKTYQNFNYIVSDDIGPNSLQIVDMQYLPDSVHVVYDDTSSIASSHTIFIDQDKLYCGSPKSNSGASSMQVYSITTPTAPVLIRDLKQDYPTLWGVHDMCVRNDTVYASCGSQGFYILKLKANNTFTLLASFTNYVTSGYNHSSWLTDNGKTLVFTDEVNPGLPAKIIDISDFSNITLLDTIAPHTLTTPHNPYVVGNNWCWLSSYRDGLYLYDISDPSNGIIYGYFDTYPQGGLNTNDYSGDDYAGNWGAYPYLPSKIIIATDTKNGVFILDGDATYKNSVGIKEQNSKQEKIPHFSIFPNPASHLMYFVIANQSQQQLNYCITDLLGNVVDEKMLNVDSPLYKTSININNLAEGYYMITLKGDKINETKQFIIQH